MVAIWSFGDLQPICEVNSLILAHKLHLYLELGLKIKFPDVSKLLASFCDWICDVAHRTAHKFKV